VDPPSTRLEELLLFKPVEAVVIDAPFMVSVWPEKSSVPPDKLIFPATVRFEPRTIVADLEMVRLLRNSEPDVKVNVPAVPLPLKVRLEVVAPPTVPDVTVKVLCTFRVFPLPIMNEPEVKVRVPTTFVTPTLLLVTPLGFAISKFTLDGNPLPSF
jgi:hypothetical protein